MTSPARPKYTMTLSFLVCAVLSLDLSAQASTRPLDVTTTTGTSLKGTFYSAGRPGPAVLLLHQCNMDRRSWTALGTALAERGIHALAIDYPGYGESPSVPDQAARVAAIDAALVALAAQPGVDSARLAAAGASCGVENAIQLAKRSGRLKALILLSGPTTPDGLAYLREHPGIPIFAATPADDGLGLSSLRTVTSTSAHAATIYRPVADGHGVTMFQSDTALLSNIVTWTASILE